jgi:ATP-dependent RNA circularization protein (DNA/RNA ligase family)
MATKNPRVVGYIQPSTHEKLKQFMEEYNISESKALDLILGEYFGVEVPRVASSSTLDVDSKINEAIAPLQKQIEELRASLGECVA